MNSYIDKPDGENVVSRPKCIDEDKVFYYISFANHRIWFHWGLSDYRYTSKSMAKSFSPLVRIVNDKIIRYDDRERFWTNLCEEEHNRLQNIYQKAAIAFGYNLHSVQDMQREQIWAFATILYCIHILGDHTTTEYKIIRDEKSLREDIFKAIRTLAGQTNKREGENLILYLQKEAPLNEIGRGTTSCSAQKLLDALKDKKNGFSHFILSCKGFGYDYKSRFKSSGRVIPE